jgi:hypothetical protein
MSFKEYIQKQNGKMKRHLKTGHAPEKLHVMHIYLSASYSSLAGTNHFSSASHASVGIFSEYTDEYKTYWVKFMALFNNRRKKESHSPTQLYNILSIKIGLSASTLASFYCHQKSPKRTSMDKIIKWVEKKGNKKVISFSNSSVVVITVAVAVVLMVEVVLRNKIDAGTLIYGLGSKNSFPL